MSSEFQVYRRMSEVSKMNTIWYEPFIHALRIHIEENHMDQRGALDELRMTEEEYAYMEVGDDEKIRLRCPWSSHCGCNWQVEGHIVIKLRDFK